VQAGQNRSHDTDYAFPTFVHLMSDMAMLRNFIRKLIRNVPVKRNSYNAFVRWLESYKPRGSTRR
jgi:hypothetical protein